MADKYNKLRVYQACIIGAVITTTIYYCFVMFGLPDHRPNLFHMFIFGEVGAVIGQLAGTVTYPLIYEYIPRNQMGAAAAGLALLRSGFGVLLGGVAGLWVTGYSAFFMPHAGSEVMAVFQTPRNEQQIVQTLAEAGRREPARFLALTPAKIHQKAWFAPGEYADASRVWVLRSANPDAARLKTQRDEWETQRVALQAELDRAHKAGRVADQAKVTDAGKLREQVRQADETLDRATAAFRTQIADAFAGDLMVEGTQIAAVSGQDHDLTLRVQIVARPAEWQLAEIKKQLNAKAYLSALTVTGGPEAVLNINAKFKTFPAQMPQLHADVAARLTLPDPVATAPVGAPTPSGGLTAGAATLYLDLVKIGPGIRLFVAEPFPRSSFAPQQHDYFSGHLLTIGGGLAALGITLLISRLERRGFIKRLGVLEDAPPVFATEVAPAEAMSQETP